MATTTNYSWTTPDDTDLVKDGAAAIRTLGSAIDTTVFNNAGAAVAKSTVDAKGDLLVGTADNTVGRLAVGTDGYTLVADSSVSPTGLKWAAPAGGGKLLQLVQGSTTTATTVATNTYADSTLTASITPSSATSKILVCITQIIYLYRNTTAGVGGDIQLLRGATAIGDFANSISAGFLKADLSGNINELIHWVAITYLDEPATTSSTTYKTQIRSNNGEITAQLNSVRSTITLMEIGA